MVSSGIVGMWLLLKVVLPLVLVVIVRNSVILVTFQGVILRVYYGYILTFLNLKLIVIFKNEN